MVRAMSKPDPLLPAPKAPSRSLGMVQSLLGVVCVVGILLLLAGGQIVPREPHPTAIEPPVLPQGAVFVGGVGEGKTPALAGHAVAIQVQEESFALTARTLFGPPTEDPLAISFRLFDPDQRAVVPLGEPRVLGGCRPDGSADVARDFVLFDLPTSDTLGPLEVQVAPPKAGDPLWIAAHEVEGLELTLTEVADVGPRQLSLFVSKRSVMGWAGAPCLDAQGAVVAIVSRVIEGEKALLIEAVLVKEALAGLSQ